MQLGGENAVFHLGNFLWRGYNQGVVTQQFVGQFLGLHLEDQGHGPVDGNVLESDGDRAFYAGSEIEVAAHFAAQSFQDVFEVGVHKVDADQLGVGGGSLL